MFSPALKHCLVLAFQRLTQKVVKFLESLRIFHIASLSIVDL